MTDPAAIIAPLHRILGAGVGVAVTDPSNPGGPLLPEEEPAVARAVPARRSEFTAGRIAARAALAQIGHPAAAIPSAPDRSPVWPAGIVGSITHCRDLCIAVVGNRHALQCIGIDIEPSTPLPADMIEIICTTGERKWLETHASTEHGQIGKQIFCAKESAYKAIYPLTKNVIEFADMRVTFNSQITHFTARTEGAPTITGYLIHLPHHILCVSVIHPKTEAPAHLG